MITDRRIGPWYTVETVQEVQHNMKRLLGEEVRWTRQGKAWTDDEILELCKIVGLEWVSIFEEALSITGELTFQDLENMKLT